MNNFDRFLTPNMLNLTDLYAVKILLCFFLKQMERPISPNQLCEIATADRIVDYFSYCEAINAMLDAGTITLEEIDGRDCYVLSEIGRRGADEFKTLVPKSFRDKILSAGLKFFAKLKNEHDVTVCINPSQSGIGWNVFCECRDGEVKLMELSLFAPDKEQAELVAEKIRLNPTSFFGKVLDFALENEEYKPDISEI